MKIINPDIFSKSYQRGVVKLITENVKEKTNKTGDNACMASGTAQNNAKGNTQIMQNDSGMRGQKVSDNVKMDANKSASDPKIAGHDAGSKSNKAST